MSRRALPILFINLGGEMMYIIDQRLKAQNIPEDKATKVLNEIISTMLNAKFVEELFKPQELYSRTALRTMFEKLAHASIMRLNAASMDKLFDLMMMVLKYQICRCSAPMEIILVTLNHLEAVKNYAGGSTDILRQVDHVYAMLIAAYASMEAGELQSIRYTILNFLQDFRIRVSILLKERLQNPNGRFVLPRSGQVPLGTEPPGVITYFAPEGDVSHSEIFEDGGDYQPASQRPPTYDLIGYKGTDLGCNIYAASADDGPENLQSQTPSSRNSVIREDNPFEMPSGSTTGKQELALLSMLIGKRDPNEDAFQFKLSLLNTDAADEETETLSKEASHHEDSMITIDAKCHSQRTSQLDRIAKEMAVEENKQQTESEDLLYLLDSV